ncbi:MAG: ABC transporter substrate-binding protein [Spirochaetales bacterium]|nr:ABC transporter substrate-binding protein [Spirochaetales bacterium]
MRKIYILCLLLLSATMVFANGTAEELKTRISVISNGSLVLFTDDLGRKIEVKDGGFKKVIAGTPAAQNYIYAINPSRLYGLSLEWPIAAEKLVDVKALNTPYYGSFTYLYDGLDYEMIKSSNADLVLIIADEDEYKSEITAILDEKQAELGIPFAYINDDLDKIPSTIARVAMIISSYNDSDDLRELSKELLLPIYSTRNIVSYYYSASSDGLIPFAEGAPENSVMDYMGMKNVVPKDSAKPMTAEDLMKANPDIILLTDETAYMNLTETPEFKNVRAIKEGKVYLVPRAPYNILSEDFGAGRLLGLQWIRMLAYNNLTKNEIVDDADDFYEEFYHKGLSDMEIWKILEL